MLCHPLEKPRRPRHGAQNASPLNSTTIYALILGGLIAPAVIRWDLGGGTPLDEKVVGVGSFEHMPKREEEELVHTSTLTRRHGYWIWR